MSDPASGLTHLDARGQARMVDVTAKEVSERSATAEGWVLMGPAAFEAVAAGTAKKGDVLATARLAGIMAAKRTSELIPLCHPLPLTSVKVEVEPEGARQGVRVVATCRVTGRTGVEMEALTAVSVAALTVYDMVKAVDKGMRIEGIRLLRKEGGKSGLYEVSP